MWPTGESRWQDTTYAPEHSMYNVGVGDCVTEYELKRPWESCLVVNKQMWKDRAAEGWISPLQESTSTGNVHS